MEDDKADLRKNFMKPSYEDPMKKREDFAVSLRKKKNQEIITAKRRKIMTNSKSHTKSYTEEEKQSKVQGPDEMNTVYKGYLPFERDSESYEKILAELCPEALILPTQYDAITDDDIIKQRIVTITHAILARLIDVKLLTYQQLVLLTALRRLLSHQTESPPVREILETTNLLSILTQVFKFANSLGEEVRSMKLEALWIITNLAYGTIQDAEKIVMHQELNILGIVSAVLRDMNDLMAVEQCLWLIGNLSSESRGLRDHILIHTCTMEAMLKLSKHPQLSKSLVKTLCWLACNMTRHKQLSDEHVHICLQVAKMGIFVTSEEVVSDCLWVLSFISDTDQDDWLERVAQGDVLHVLCQSLLSDNESLYVPAIKSLGSILTSNDPMVIDRCLWSSFLDHLSVLLKNLIQDQARNDTLRESCWALSNMTASANSLDKFIESPCFALIVDISMNTSLKRDTRKEAIWVLCNSITGSGVELQVKMLQISELRLVPIIIESFRLDPEHRLSLNLLESLDELLKLDQLQGWKETDRSIAYLVERTGGLDVLETVQRNPNYQIYKMAADITSKYFEVDSMQVTQSAQQQQRPSSGGVQGTNQPMFNI